MTRLKYGECKWCNYPLKKGFWWYRGKKYHKKCAFEAFVSLANKPKSKKST
jgi:hypothetical protein